MKNSIIAILVGAVILFLWQFMSWSALNIHGSEIQYTPNQDKILPVLSEHLTEGSYFLPTVPPGSSSDEHERAAQNAEGKPWATINYHPSFQLNFGMNLLRGFVSDVVAVWLLVWLLGKMPTINFNTTVMVSLAIGVIGYLMFPYMNNIWFEIPTLGAIIDTVVQWSLVGAWLGWWLNRD